MKKVSLYLCLLLSSLFANAQSLAKEDKRFSGLDKEINDILKNWHTAGVAVAIVEKNKIIYAKGFGYRDYEKKLPVTPNTVFAIGSSTKAFTSSLLGILRDEQKLDFETPVRHYLPELVFSNEELNSKVTLQDMMCHRTGLSRYDLAWYLFTTNSRDTLLHRIRYMVPNEPFRAKWQYNNFMFLAQGVVAEKLTGKSWEENIQTRIFDKLDMQHSYTTIEGLKQHPDAALGYNVKNDSLISRTQYKGLYAIAPAGSINSNVNDMANWVITWINGGKFKGKEILSPRYTREAMSPQMVVERGLPDKETPDVYFTSYGYGWVLSSYRGHYQVEHGGNIDGFSASVCFYPSDSVGIIILTNQSVSAVPVIVGRRITDRLLGLKAFDWNGMYLKKMKAARAGKDKKDSTQAKVKGADVIRVNSDYEGMYVNAAYGSFKVISRKDSLFITYPIGTDYLKHISYDIFQPFSIDSITGIDSTENVPIRIQFLMNTKGDITSARIDLDQPEPVIFVRGANITDSKDLQKYMGTYELNGMKATVYLKDEWQLMVNVPGQPDYTLLPGEQDKFDLKELKGFSVVFNLNDKHEVISITFVQPNGRFTAIKK